MVPACRRLAIGFGARASALAHGGGAFVSNSLCVSTAMAGTIEVGAHLRVWTGDKGNSQTGDMGDSGTMGARGGLVFG